MNNATPHAPPPWDWQTSETESNNGSLHTYIVDASGRKIAAVWGKQEEKIATATMMVAAPDLVKALQDAPDFGGEPTTAFGRQYREWQIQMRAALAKASAP